MPLSPSPSSSYLPPLRLSYSAFTFSSLPPSRLSCLSQPPCVIIFRIAVSRFLLSPACLFSPRLSLHVSPTSSSGVSAIAVSPYIAVSCITISPASPSLTSSASPSLTSPASLSLMSPTSPSPPLYGLSPASLSLESLVSRLAVFTHHRLVFLSHHCISRLFGINVSCVPRLLASSSCLPSVLSCSSVWRSCLPPLSFAPPW